MKKILSLLLSILFLTVLLFESDLFCYHAVAADMKKSQNVVATGMISSVKWTFFDDGVLEISGSGEIPSYSSSVAPWDAYKDRIVSIIVDNGITKINEGAFKCCQKVKTISLPFIGERRGAMNYQSAFACIFGIKDSISVFSPGGAVIEWTDKHNYNALYTEAYYYDNDSDAIVLDRYLERSSNLYYLRGTFNSVFDPNRVSVWDGAGKTLVFGKVKYESSMTESQFEDKTVKSNNLNAAISNYSPSTLRSKVNIVGHTTEHTTNLYKACREKGLVSKTQKPATLCVGNLYSTLPYFSGYYTRETYSQYVGSLSTYTDYWLTTYYYAMPNSLEEVVITGSVSVPDYAFLNCINLKSIKFSDEVYSVGQAAFMNCKNVRTLDLRVNEVKDGQMNPTISTGALWGCISLTQLSVDVKCNSFSNLFSLGYFFGESEYSGGKMVLQNGKTYCVPLSLSEVTISSEMDILSPEAFAECDMLKKVTIESQESSLKKNMFAFCRGLTEVNMPQSTSIIPEGCFYQCESLKELSIPSSTHAIEEKAFFGCVSLKHLTFPSSVITIGEKTLDNSIGLEKVCVRNNSIELDENWLGSISPTIYCYEYSNTDSWCFRHGYSTEVGNLVYLDDLEYSEYGEVTSKQPDCTLDRGEIFSTNILFFPSYAEYSVRYSSSDPSVATIDAGGVVTAREKGTAFITAEYQGISTSFEVMVTARLHGFTLNETDVSMYPNRTFSLSVNANPVDADATFTWESSSPSNVSVQVSEDTRTATIRTNRLSEPGDYQITVYSGDLSERCSVHVSRLADYSVTPESATILVNRSVELNVVGLEPSDSDAVFLWNTTSDLITIAPSKDTRSAIVTATKDTNGTATISISSNGIQRSCSITVEQVSDYSIPEKTYVVVKKPTCVPLSIDPEDATAAFEWASSDTSLLVDPAWDTKSATITGSKVGTYSLTISTGGKSRSGQIIVCYPVQAVVLSDECVHIHPNQDQQIIAVVSTKDSEYRNKLVAFTSLNENIATVDGNGVIHGVNEGYTQIQVSDGAGITELCDVYVCAGEMTSRIISSATCVDPGCKEYYCEKNCGFPAWREDIPALGHDYVHHDPKAATCTEIGWNAYDTCSRCNYTSYSEIAALGHDYVHHDAKAASCTAIGWNAYDTCSRCDYSTYAEIDALGHDYVHHDAKSATCTEIGWNAYDTCSRCDYTSYSEIVALGHDYVHHDGKSATCTVIGWSAYNTCSRCDYTTYEEIAALGHDYVHHDAKAATCTEIGWNAYDTCSRCDYTTYEEIVALGHSKTDIWTSDATEHWHVCQHDGCEERFDVAEHLIEDGVCTICGYQTVLIGDLDGDGEVTDWDAVLMARYLAGWNVDVNLDAMDIDGDGEITDWDSVLFDRYMAGWNVEIEIKRTTLQRMATSYADEASKKRRFV